MTGDWRARAVCGPDTAHLFDPLADSDRGDRGEDRIAQAKGICTGCPVRLDCLTEAIEDGEHGVRGGEYLIAGSVQSEVARRGRPLSPCGTPSARTRHRRFAEQCAVCWPPVTEPRVGRPSRPPAKTHGTHAAFARHRYHGEDPCEECVEAERKYQHERSVARGGGVAKPPQPHGTHAAFARHRYHGEDPCEECVKAERTYWRQWQAARRSAVAS